MTAILREAHRDRISAGVSSVNDATVALPGGWNFIPLKFAVEDAQTGIWGEEPNGGKDDIPCARVADFDRLKVNVTEVPTIRRVSEKDRTKCTLAHGDILVEKSGGTDRNPVGTVVAYEGEVPAVYANFIFRLRMNTKHDSRFWLYALHGSYIVGRTWNFVRQTTGIQNLDVNGFLSMTHAAPALENQRAIADYLDRETSEIDAMIGKMDELTVQLEVRRGSMIRSAVADIEDTLPRVPLQALAQIGSGEAIASINISDVGDVPVYGGNGVRGFTGSFNQQEDRVLIGRQGALCGNVHIAPGPFWASEHALVMKPYVELELRWLAYATRDLELGRLSNAAAQPGITASGVGREKLPYPSLNEQHRIADHLDEVTGKIDAMLAKVAHLKSLLIERRAALITDVVTGKKDIS